MNWDTLHHKGVNSRNQIYANFTPKTIPPINFFRLFSFLESFQDLKLYFRVDIPYDVKTSLEYAMYMYHQCRDIRYVNLGSKSNLSGVSFWINFLLNWRKLGRVRILPLDVEQLFLILVYFPSQMQIAVPFPWDKDKKFMLGNWLDSSCKQYESSLLMLLYKF